MNPFEDKTGLAGGFKCPEGFDYPSRHMSYSLNSLKGYIGEYIGDYYRGY